MYYGTWDVQGLLSTLPALVTCQMGVFTGVWLKRDWQENGSWITNREKAILLAITGAFILGLGILWGFDFPINKKIWTSSYTLLTGGLSATIMAIFYWLIDVQGYKKWAFPFIVIGFNSIFIYLMVNILPFHIIVNWLFDRELSLWFGAWREFSRAFLTLLAGWLILYMMLGKRYF